MAFFPSSKRTAVLICTAIILKAKLNSAIYSLPPVKLVASIHAEFGRAARAQYYLAFKLLKPYAGQRNVFQIAAHHKSPRQKCR
jgi:hypothetical protein